MRVLARTPSTSSTDRGRTAEPTSTASGARAAATSMRCSARSAPSSRPGDVVLDIGCGVGRLTRVLAERAAHVHAIDVSAEMLEQARGLNAHLTNVSWHHGDGTTLQPIEDALGRRGRVPRRLPAHPRPAGHARLRRRDRPGAAARRLGRASRSPTIRRFTGRAVGLAQRVKAAVGRAPRGQDEPEWLGSAVDLDDVRAAAMEGGLDVERVAGEATQFCFVRAVRALTQLQGLSLELRYWPARRRGRRPSRPRARRGTGSARPPRAS